MILKVNSMRQWIACVELMAVRVGLQTHFKRTRFPSTATLTDVGNLIKHVRKDRIINVRMDALRKAKMKRIKVAPMHQRINELFGNQDSSSSDSE